MGQRLQKKGEVQSHFLQMMRIPKKDNKCFPIIQRFRTYNDPPGMGGDEEESLSMIYNIKFKA